MQCTIFPSCHVFQQNTGTMAVDQFHFLLVQDAEISEINKLTVKTAASKDIARATKTWMAAWAEWCKARNINLYKTVSEKRICDFFNIPLAQSGACSFGKSTRCMHVGECSTSSSNQFKPSMWQNSPVCRRPFTTWPQNRISQRHFKF